MIEDLTEQLKALENRISDAEGYLYLDQKRSKLNELEAL